MNESITALESYINDFALKEPDGIVYFYATIQFDVNGHLQELDSDVHILTSDNLATIYILGLGAKPWELPDMFTPKKDVFTYRKKQCLIIQGKGDAGEYSVGIYPKDMKIF